MSFIELAFIIIINEHKSKHILIFTEKFDS
jgi:hypothetical protein